MSGSVKTYCVSDISNNPNITLDGSFQAQPKFITINRFEWYPTQPYYTTIPQVFIHFDTLAGKFLSSGSQQDLILVVNRDQNNNYEFQKSYPDPVLCQGGLTGSLNIRFTDVNGELLNMGILNGVVDTSAISYYIEFSINY